MERGDHTASDDPGPEAARRSPGDGPNEDQLGLIRAAEVEVLPDDLLEQDVIGERAVQNLRWVELQLKYGEVAAISGGAVRVVKEVRPDRQSPAEESVGRLGRQTVADLLFPPGVLA